MGIVARLMRDLREGQLHGPSRNTPGHRLDHRGHIVLGSSYGSDKPLNGVDHLRLKPRSDITRQNVWELVVEPGH
jgi:hypothetical protein